MSSDRLQVAFLNENTLGHTSYLPRFAAEFDRQPDLAVEVHALDVTPLPPALQRRADFSIRGLRKVGLDFQAARWRSVVSGHARRLLDDLRARQRLDAVVVNTQSAGLHLADLPSELPVFVCLDATFRQLQRSRWFALNRVAAWLTPLTLASLLVRERRLFASATHFLPWSGPVRDSLVHEYRVDPDRITLMPPSLDLNRFRPSPAAERTRWGRDRRRARLLFVGGDFRRKGGPKLLEAFRTRLADRAELHLVTQSDVPPEPGVVVHRGVHAGSPEWLGLWSQADLFVFPSELETFGIVLIEALAFGVPVIASCAGAASDILEDGRLGTLLERVGPDSLADAIQAALHRPEEVGRQVAAAGRRRVECDFDLTRNTARLAEALRRRVSAPA